MNKAFLILTYVILHSYFSSAQNGFSKLYRYSGDTILRADLVPDIIFDSNGNNLYFPTYGYYHNEPKISSALYKSDLNGVVIKEVLDTFPTGHSVFYESVALSKDHQFVYWGGSVYVYGNISQWKIRKTDTNLNVIWDKYYDCNKLSANISAIKMLPEDESFLALMQAYTVSDNGWGYPAAPARIYLKHIDSAGNVISSDTLGPGNYDNPNDLELSEDGSYLINGRTFSWGQNNGSGYALKADADGNEVWHQLYAQDAYSTWLQGMAKSKETIESYYNVGQIAPLSDLNGIGFINKIDKNGNELWERKIGVNGISDGFYSVSTAINNSDIATVGYVYYPDFGYSRGWITRLDKDGNDVWNKLYTRNPPNNFQEYLYSIAGLPDGGFVAAGSSWGQMPNGQWTQDGWVIRVDSNGCISPDDCGQDVGVEAMSHNKDIHIYPNPANENLTIEVKNLNQDIDITLYDMQGRSIKRLPVIKGNSTITLNTNDITAGVYWLNIQTSNGHYAKKITIIH